MISDPAEALPPRSGFVEINLQREVPPLAPRRCLLLAVSLSTTAALLRLKCPVFLLLSACLTFLPEFHITDKCTGLNDVMEEEKWGGRGPFIVHYIFIFTSSVTESGQKVSSECWLKVSGQRCPSVVSVFKKRHPSNLAAQ